MKRPISDHAHAAKLIRAELKKQGVKASVTSSTYAGGNSVDVDLIDEHPDTVKAVEAFAQQYQRGHFDGMDDSYKYSNRREDIPQVYFVFVRGGHSDELKDAAWDYARETYADAVGAPDRGEISNLQVGGRWADSFIHMLCNGAEASDFWTDRTPTSPGGFTSPAIG